MDEGECVASNEHRAVGGTSNEGDIFTVSLVVVAGALAIAVLMPFLSSWFAMLPEYLLLGAG